MAFNLKKVLKALLLSSSQPLSIKDIQAAFTRFHQMASQLPLAAERNAEGEGQAPGGLPEARDANADGCRAAGSANAVGRVLQSFLVQTSTHDPVTLLSIVVLLTVVAVAACVGPARRATRLDPLNALRHD